MDDRTKITNGLNDRPLNETIAQTGPGLPDDSGQPVEIDPGEVEKMRAALERDAGNTAEDESGSPRLRAEPGA